MIIFNNLLQNINKFKIEIIVCFGIAVVMFVINGIIGSMLFNKKSLFKYGRFSFCDDEQTYTGNFTLRIINPLIVILLVSAYCQRKGFASIIELAWLIPVFFWLIRFFYIIIILRRGNLLNWKYEVFCVVLSLGLCILEYHVICRGLYEKGQSILIPVTDFRNAIWYTLFGWLLKVVWDGKKEKLDAEKLYPNELKVKAVIKRFVYFKNKYNDTIENELNQYQHNYDTRQPRILFYAIMIFEDYNRPVTFRWIERLLSITHIKKKVTTGIMQIESDVPMSDIESIKQAVARIYPSDLKDSWWEDIIRQYNGDSQYRDEVLSIADIISQKEYGVDFVAINGKDTNQTPHTENDYHTMTEEDYVVKIGQLSEQVECEKQNIMGLYYNLGNFYEINGKEKESKYAYKMAKEWFEKTNCSEIDKFIIGLKNQEEIKD